MKRVFELFPILGMRRNERAHHLSGGEQQMLVIGRALMGNPELLILDEPFEGLAPIVREQLSKEVILLRKTGLSMLLAEHNITAAAERSDRCYIVEKGRVCFQGDIKEVTENREIMERYIGVSKFEVASKEYSL